MTPSEQRRIVQRLVETMGHTTQSLGIGRVLGQIFAYLYLSPQPCSLDDITTTLAISKGSASMGVRQLEQWGAVEKVWVKGDRKDYYQARDALGRIVRNAATDLARKRIESSTALLLQAEQELASREGAEGDGAATFMRKRVGKMAVFLNKAQRIWETTIAHLLRQGSVELQNLSPRSSTR